MKKFTCPCFVRIDDESQRMNILEFLINLGYIKSYIHNDDAEFIFCHGEKDYVLSYGFGDSTTKFPECGFDCGDNIELFKSLATMNDTDDYLQLFTNGLGNFELSQWKSWANFWNGDPYEGVYYDWRKATKEEIIKHFTK